MNLFEKSKITLEELLDVYREEMIQSSKYSVGTKNTYAKTMNAIKRKDIVKSKVKKITTRDLQNLFDEFSRELEKSRLLAYSAVLKHTFEYGIYPLKVIKENPMDHVDIYSKINEKDLFHNESYTNVLTHNEYLKIMSYLDRKGSFYKLPIQISYYSGLRLGEVCGLSWNDINLEEQYIVVRRALVKNTVRGGRYEFTTPKRNKVRIVEIPDVLKNILVIEKEKYETREIKNYYKKILEDNKEVFPVIALPKDKIQEGLTEIKLVCTRHDGTYINRQSMECYFKRMAKNLELNHFHFHVLRHTYATNLLNLGASMNEVKELLGHSDIGTTMNIYIHSSRKELKQAVQHLNAIGKE
jgi:integrase